MRLVLSLFPGIGLLDMAFEEEGFCVVRGPDLLWGGDIRRFNPPAGKFDGVIGGPPCQMHTALKRLERASGEPTTTKAHNRPGVQGNMIPEFERCVEAAKPLWWVMENVPGAPVPQVPGYQASDAVVNNRQFGAEQNRVRRFTLGTPDGFPLVRHVEFSVFKNPIKAAAVTTYEFGGKSNPSYGRSVDEMARLQGLPAGFDLPGMTVEAKRRAIANGVPLPMGRAIAKAIAKGVVPHYYDTDSLGLVCSEKRLVPA